MTFKNTPFLAAILVASTHCFASPSVAQNVSLDTHVSAAMAERDYTKARGLLADMQDDEMLADMRAIYAQLLLNGQGGPIDAVAGRAQLAAAADQGHAAAAVLLARIYLSGASAGVDRDPEKAVIILEGPAASGHPEGLYYMGILTRAGSGTAKDENAGTALLVKSAEAGFAPAQFELSKILSTSAPPETAAALHWLKEAAKGGITEAQFFLANAYEAGQGAPLEKAEALMWFRRAAEGGMPIAQRILGTKYLSTTPQADANPIEAVRWLTAAAQAGDPGAMNNLGIAYGGDSGVNRDDAQAMAWFKQASDIGLARATFALAQYHESGRGTPVDIKAAALLYRTASEQGDARGAVRLGVLTGKGALDQMVPRHLSVPWARAAAIAGDEGALSWLGAQAQDGMRAAQSAYGILLLARAGRAEEAIDMLTRAADAGVVDAQYALGNSYTTGTGVALDYEAAHMWLNIAAASGHAQAAEQRELIGNLMTPDQIANAQEGARTFFETASDRLPENVQNKLTQP